MVAWEPRVEKGSEKLLENKKLLCVTDCHVQVPGRASFLFVEITMRCGVSQEMLGLRVSCWSFGRPLP